ncbi:MAG: hypothetical protein COV75_01460 [Candidatus Omnitrophica bacterium CG11_big_fil_rev_8_21_14_0_20_63_9]|nr:MAG: hypothetical protein COV75_01460 [Candidatus Omnitrophica bacterium CG11_big_fil_rev_8_21_14_0_20_63_9]
MSLVAVLTGCESLQRKFTRKPKHPKAAPTPIINFQDYSKIVTPMDRYRKHYVMFEYWNDELVEALSASPPLNAKRLKLASTEALGEMSTLHSLVVDELAQRMSPMLEHREKLTRQLQQGSLSVSDADAIRRVLETQSRDIHRSFYWRDLEGQLKPLAEQAAPAEPADPPSGG